MPFRKHNSSKSSQKFTASLQVTSLEIAEVDYLRGRSPTFYVTVLVDGKEQKRVDLGKHSNVALAMPKAIDVTLRPSSIIEICVKRQSCTRMDWFDRSICKVKRGVVELAIKNDIWLRTDKGAAGNVRVKLDVDSVAPYAESHMNPWEDLSRIFSRSSLSADQSRTLVADDLATPGDKQPAGEVHIKDDRTLGILRFEAGLKLLSAYHKELLESALFAPNMHGIPPPRPRQTRHRKEATKKVEKWLQDPNNTGSHYFEGSKDEDGLATYDAINYFLEDTRNDVSGRVKQWLDSTETDPGCSGDNNGEEEGEQSGDHLDGHSVHSLPKPSDHKGKLQVVNAMDGDGLSSTERLTLRDRNMKSGLHVVNAMDGDGLSTERSTLYDRKRKSGLHVVNAVDGDGLSTDWPIDLKVKPGMHVVNVDEDDDTSSGPLNGDSDLEETPSEENPQPEAISQVQSVQKRSDSSRKGKDKELPMLPVPTYGSHGRLPSTSIHGSASGYPSRASVRIDDDVIHSLCDVLRRQSPNSSDVSPEDDSSKAASESSVYTTHSSRRRTASISRLRLNV